MSASDHDATEKPGRQEGEPQTVERSEPGRPILEAQEGEPLKRHGDALRSGNGSRQGDVAPGERPNS